jgi:hypothetical protein
VASKSIDDRARMGLLETRNANTNTGLAAEPLPAPETTGDAVGLGSSTDNRDLLRFHPVDAIWHN